MPPKALLLGRPVYRGYMPPGLPQHRKRVLPPPWDLINSRPKWPIPPPEQKPEWTDEPEYPPLNDGSNEGLRRGTRLEWYDKIKELPTVDAKLHEIVRHAMHYIAHFPNFIPVHNSRPFVQYLTRTHFINKLPDSYLQAPKPTQDTDSANLTIDTNKAGQISRIKDLLLDQIAVDKYESDPIRGQFISKTSRDGHRCQYISSSLVQDIAQTLRRALAPDVNNQLLDYQIDPSPAIRSWWYHSGFKAPNNKVYYKSRKDEDGRINQMIQCDGRSALSFRSEHMMEPILGIDDELVTDAKLIQENNYTPKYYSARYKFKWPVALAGYWFTEPSKYDCPHTCFLTTDSLTTANQLVTNYAKPLSDTEDALNTQAILTAFSWMNSLSMYHGYTPYQEIDYPFTCQVITTDGQNWLFNVYQMNSHTFHRDLGGPQRNNICWSSGLMKLYDQYEGNGKFSGVNDEVLSLIIRYFAQQTSPSYTESLDMRPHLHEDTRTEQEKETTMKELRDRIEQRNNKWLAAQWQVPLFEHIFFRSKTCRYQIKHMKPYWHIPKPKTPKMFE